MKHRHKLCRNRPLDSLVDDERAWRDFQLALAICCFDYSKTIDGERRVALLGYLTPAGRCANAKRCSGAPINETEGRAVLHTALRNLDGGPVKVDGVDVMPGCWIHWRGWRLSRRSAQ